MQDFLPPDQILRLVRVQKHDILNHLQVISGYLQLNKADKALEYTREVTEEIMENGSVMRLGKPVLTLALMQKQLEMNEAGLDLKLTNQTDLTYIDVPEEKLTELLLKTIDNWLEMSVNTGSNTLNLRFSEQQEAYIIEYTADFPESFKQPGKLKNFDTIIRETGCRYETANSPGKWQVIYIVPKTK